LGLGTARAYAASVVLPDGRLWVLGGADQSTILQSTEFIIMADNTIKMVRPGPNMPEPLMNHCAAWVSATQVVVLGGFSSVLNDYTPSASVYDFSTQQWIQKSWMNPEARIDGSCLNVFIGGQRRVLLAGGWNNEALSDTAVFSGIDFHWSYLSGSGNSSNPLPYPLRSSVMIERNQVPYLIGGVTCTSRGMSCKPTNKSNIKIQIFKIPLVEIHFLKAKFISGYFLQHL